MAGPIVTSQIGVEHRDCRPVGQELGSNLNLPVGISSAHVSKPSSRFRGQALCEKACRFRVLLGITTFPGRPRRVATIASDDVNKTAQQAAKSW